MKIKNKSIYGIGNPLLDILVNVDDETIEKLGFFKGVMHLIDNDKKNELLEFIKSLDVSYYCGGSCPNTIIALGSLGVKSLLGGKVGNDKEGLIYKQRLKELNIGDSLSQSNNSTGSTIIMISSDGERTMNTYLGANRDFNVNDVDEKAIKEAGIFHFTGYMFDTDCQKEAIIKCLELCKKYDTRVSFDVADSFAVARNKQDFISLIKNYSDIVFANSDEARMLFEHYESRVCCRALHEICNVAIVKNGKSGSFIGYNKEILSIPVQGPVVPVDTTGAGDMYASGFLYGLLNNKDIKTTSYIASLLAGEIICQVGAQFTNEKAIKMKKKLERL